jgi:hypothetical protein
VFNLYLPVAWELLPRRTKSSEKVLCAMTSPAAFLSQGCYLLHLKALSQQAEYLGPSISLYSPELSNMFTHPALQCIQGIPLGLDAGYLWRHKLSKWEPAQPTGYKVPYNEPQFPVLKEGKL